jgi:hypothetical protein
VRGGVVRDREGRLAQELARVNVTVDSISTLSAYIRMQGNQAYAVVQVKAFVDPAHLHWGN